MKNMKKILALLVAVLMIVASVSAFADESTKHTIKITNADQNVVHTYEGYQIFKGKLDAAQEKLTEIQWGDGVDGPALLTALQASTVLKSGDPAKNIFEDCVTPADVAAVLSKLTSTDNVNAKAGDIDEVAKIIGETDGVLKSTAKIAFTAGDKDYTAEVTGDGYYFVKDVTENLVNQDTKGSDTLSKYLLSVVKDVTITAKDTGITPDKDILIKEGHADPADYERVKENTAAIGNVIPFEVKVNVPNTVKYDDHFWFKMEDTLCAGLSYLNFEGITINGTALPVANYEVTVTEADGTTTYTLPADAHAAAEKTGGQKINVTFKNFKKYVEDNNLIGKQIVLTYNAVLNEKAEVGKTGNKNEVVFKYSNDPNHDYDGDDITDDDVVGTTPKSETITYVTTLEILKRDGNTQKALAGATFQIVGESYDMVVETGEKFEKTPYDLKDKEERVGTDVYYLLKDGTYTKTPSNSATEALYASTSDTYWKVKYTAVTKTVPSTHTETVVSGEDGKITQIGLKPGTYTITETVAPEGYNKITDTFTLEIAWIDPTDANATAEQKAAGGFYIGDGTTKKDNKPIFTMTADGAKYEITIDNFGGQTLPSTGGMGTTILYVGGSILVILAAVLLITKRRMSADE